MILNMGIYKFMGKLFIVETVIYYTHKMSLRKMVFRFYSLFLKDSFLNLMCQSQGVQTRG
jgi:hypothetical protein